MCAAIAKMTPQNPHDAVAEGSTISGTEKKRNKLGYHRTSVACVHCRRRKIRCLVAQDDAQGRCENCIRLRKECQYFPVDQQPAVEKKSRPNSRVGSVSTEQLTASLSPSTISGATDQREPFFPYQSIPLTSSQDIPGTGAGTFTGSSMGSFAPGRNVGPAEFAAPPSLDPSVPWDEFTTISDPQMLANMNAGKRMLTPNVWNAGGQPIAPMTPNSPIPGPSSVPPQSQTIGTGQGFAMQPDGSMWPVPQARTMGFPTQPEMASPYSAQFPPNVPPDMEQRMASPGQGLPGAPPAAAAANPQNALPADLQPSPASVSFPGQQPPMTFPTYQDMNGMLPLNVVPYPMFSREGNPMNYPGQPPPMGPPGQGGHTSSS